MGRKRLKPGDVFRIPLSEGVWGFGQILLHREFSYDLYVAIFRRAWPIEVPSIEEIVADEVALLGGTMDALIYHGDWVVIGSCEPGLERMPWPPFQVMLGDGRRVVEAFDGRVIREARESDLERLDHRWSRSAIAFQDALRALHGYAEWRDDYEKLTYRHAEDQARAV